MLLVMLYPNTEWEENSYEAHLIGQEVIVQHESSFVFYWECMLNVILSVH